MLTANLATLVGLSLIATVLIAVFCSPYRHLLKFMLAGMVFWGLVEVIRFSTHFLFELPIIYSYLAASVLAMVVVAVLLLLADRRTERALIQRRCIEHTPGYEEEQQCSSR